jgi:outer membrane biosynthesis protein TonB
MSQELRTNDRYEREHRRTMSWAMLAAVLVHIIFVLIFAERRPLPLSPFSAAGPRTGDVRAAAGGGLEVVAIRSANPVEANAEEEVIEVPEPEPEPVPDEIEQPEPEPATAVAAASETAGDAGPGRGETRGPGTDAGTGTGDGGTAEDGRFRVVAPTPRGLILPPSDRPGRVRGREVAVWVFVNAQGGVVADSTRLDPGTGDRGFDNRLREQAAQWRFEPARRAGNPVAEWFRYVIVL